MKRINLSSSGFFYFQTGKTPRLLIHAGTHGDEFEVINIVTDCVNKYQHQLAPLIYVPNVSPSAVATHCRLNHYKHDLNRIFYDNFADSEVRHNIEIINKGPFDLLVSFHEDLESNDYYIYDTNFDNRPTNLVVAHNSYLQTRKIHLLTGFDDPDDPALGYKFVNGYRKFTHRLGDPDNGMILVWALNRQLIKHSLLPEIPGPASLEIKTQIIDSFFQQVLISMSRKLRSVRTE